MSTITPTRFFFDFFFFFFLFFFFLFFFLFLLVISKLNYDPKNLTKIKKDWKVRSWNIVHCTFSFSFTVHFISIFFVLSFFFFLFIYISKMFKDPMLFVICYLLFERSFILFPLSFFLMIYFSPLSWKNAPRFLWLDSNMPRWFQSCGIFHKISYNHEYLWQIDIWLLPWFLADFKSSLSF